MSPRIDTIHDTHEVDDDEGRHGSLEQLAPVARRASKCREQKEVSSFHRVWGRESQSGYKGRKVLGLDADEKSSRPLGAYAANSVDAERSHFSEYELPQRYGGKQTSYRGEVPIIVVGSHGSWSSPGAKQRRFCGLGKWTIWLVVIIICLLVLCVTIGGMVVGIESSARKAVSDNTNSYTTFMDVSSATKTTTMANGMVVVTTQVFTSLTTIKPSTIASQMSAIPATSTTTSSVVSSETTAHYTSSSSSSDPSSSFSASTSTPPTSTPSPSSGTLLPLACPSLDGTTASTSVSAQFFTYTIFCNTNFHSGDIHVVNASSLVDCYSACAHYTHLQPGTCKGAVYHANLSSVEGAGGNCNLKNDIKMSYSTGTSDLIAAAVMITGGQSRSVQGRWVGGGLKIPLA